MFICNNYRFRGDWGKVGPIENYVKNILGWGKSNFDFFHVFQSEKSKLLFEIIANKNLTMVHIFRKVFLLFSNFFLYIGLGKK